MAQVRNISMEEARKFLQEVKFGHLAYAYEGQPYIVPLHFGYDGENIYFFTTDGTKTRILAANPKVCLQVERVEDTQHWQSVMVFGTAEPLTNLKEIERAVGYLQARDLPRPPEMNKATYNHRLGGNKVTVYVVRPKTITGRNRHDEATEEISADAVVEQSATAEETAKA